MRLAVYIISFLAFLLMAFGILFKIQHWPGGQVLQIGGYLWAGIAGLLMLIYKIRQNKKEEVQEEKPNKRNDSILDA
jgi:hypothetical protein